MSVRWALSKYIITLRVIYDGPDEMDAKLAANDLHDHTREILKDDDSVYVTQILPYEGHYRAVEPTELVESMRHCVDLLIMTKITQCFELAQSLDKTAWVLEHRDEETFDLNGYDHAAIFDRAKILLGRKSG